jgi:hypothetical protein
MAINEWPNVVVDKVILPEQAPGRRAAGLDAMAGRDRPTTYALDGARTPYSMTPI